MIKLYLSRASSSSCRKARTWLTNHQIPFEEINLNKTSEIPKHDFLHILSLTEAGLDDIIAKKSDIYKELDIDFENITISEILSLINEHRALIKRPIIVDDTHLQIGFNDDGIRQFIPRNYRYTQKEIFEQNLYENKSNFSN